MPSVPSSLLFLPRPPIWFLVSDDHALLLTYRRQGGKINNKIVLDGI